MCASIWNENVLKRFKSVENDSTFEKRYYAPYNKLLNSIFPSNTNFTVSPVAYPVDSRDSIDFAVEYLITIEEHDQNTPVLFIEIKDPTTLSSLASRRSANDQMIHRFEQLINTCHIPILYGISAFGTKILIYTLNIETGDLNPTFPPPHPHKININITKDTWNLDILENEGAVVLNNVFTHVMQMCNEL